MVGKLWYLWRTGYGTYLSVPIATGGALVSVYYLMVERVMLLKELFPTFSSFATTGVVLCLIAGIGLGWLHFSILKLYDAEVRVVTTSNPFYYETTPGKEREVLWPMYAELMEHVSTVSTEITVRERTSALASRCRMLARGGRLSR